MLECFTTAFAKPPLGTLTEVNLTFSDKGGGNYRVSVIRRRGHRGETAGGDSDNVEFRFNDFGPGIVEASSHRDHSISI